MNEAAKAAIGLRPGSDGFGFKLIRKRDQPSLPVETPVGDWNMRQNIPKNLLWLLVINLEIAYGALAYMKSGSSFLNGSA